MSKTSHLTGRRSKRESTSFFLILSKVLSLPSMPKLDRKNVETLILGNGDAAIAMTFLIAAQILAGSIFLSLSVFENLGKNVF